MNEEWIKLSKLGCLYIEKILVRFDIPLLFVCNTKSNGKYLTLCINEETNEFLLAKCSNDILLKLVDGQKSIDSVFQTARTLFLVDYGSGRCKNLSIKDVSEDMLPDKDTFFTIKNLSIDEYIEILKNECKSFNNTDRIFIKMDTSFTITNPSMCECTEVFGNGCKSLEVKEVLEDMLLDRDIFFTITNPSMCECTEVSKVMSKECINNNNIKTLKKTNKNIINGQKKSNFGYGWNILTYNFNKGVIDGRSSETNKITSAA